MTDLQLELTRLIGVKELTLGCKIKDKQKWLLLTVINSSDWFYIDDLGKTYYSDYFEDEEEEENEEIIGHPATLSDLHRWLNDSTFNWFQSNRKLTLQWSQKKWSWFIDFETSIVYDTELDLLDQKESTLKAIIDLIKEHANH